MIKRETRPAYHIAFLHIVCTLALTGLTLIFVPDASARDHSYCDKKFEELMFQEVPKAIHKQCGNRFIYNVNKIKRSFPLNYNKF